MTRFFTYDETIREHHLFNPRVYIDDVNKRAGAALYLEGLGYDISGAAVGYGEHKKLSWEIISMNNILSVDKYGIINVGCISKEEDKEKIVKELDEHAKKYRYIEVDGEQHWKPVYGRQALLKQKEHDRRKNSYALANKIPLYRIPYWEIDNIKLIKIDKNSVTDLSR